MFGALAHLAPHSPMEPPAFATALLLLGLLVSLTMWSWVSVIGLWGVFKWRAVRPLPEGTSHRPTNDDRPPVAIFIPARNEARSIGEALRSVLAQDYPNFSVCLIDDQSTDGTAEIAQRLAVEHRLLRVVRGVERPFGWAGKTWALHQVAHQETEAPYFLFLDGDVVLHRQALARAIDAARKLGADLLSFVPNLELESFWQRTVAISFAPLVSWIVPIAHVNSPKKRAAYAMGGFMLFRSETYRAIGGHEGVKGEIVEDAALATGIKQHGARLVVLPAPELVRTPYFETLPEIWAGVRKNIYAVLHYRPIHLLVATLLSAAVSFLPWIGLAFGLGMRGCESDVFHIGPAITLCAILSLGCMLSVTAFVAHFTGSSVLYALTFPLGTAFLLGAAWSSARQFHFGQGVEWKGRTISAQELATRVGRDTRRPKQRSRCEESIGTASNARTSRQ